MSNDGNQGAPELATPVTELGVGSIAQAGGSPDVKAVDEQLHRSKIPVLDVALKVSIGSV